MPSITTAQKFKLKKLIKELEQHRGRHTELVTVYIPVDYDLNKIINHVYEEQGTATNIKSASTRKNVIDALERMVQHLKLYKRTPEHGLAVFSGNIASREGQSDLRVWSIEPPLPLKFRLYRCDKEFLLDPLREMCEEKEVYGLVVIDRRDAAIALLKGKTIVPLLKTHSEVPGKTRAGGQCLAASTLLQLSDGNIIEIKDSHNPLSLKSADLQKMDISDSRITARWDTNKEALRVVTKYPRFDITCSPDHLFFVMTKEGIKEAPAESLDNSSVLLFPEKMNIKGKVQKITKRYELERRTRQSKNAKIPKEINEKLAVLAGYFLGDGFAEDDRINFYEQDKGVAERYADLLEKEFNVKAKVNFKEKKGYYEIRAYSRQLVNMIRGEFFSKKTTLSSIIPEKILVSPNKVLAAFLKGLFDAEGYISRSRVGLGINNQQLARQLQLCLLRFGIIASLLEYDNRRNPYSNKTRYSIDISEKESLKLFYESIGFSSEKKTKKLKEAYTKIPLKNNVRRIAVPGSMIRKLIERHNMNMQRFPRVSGFFRNDRMMSKDVFKNSIISNVKDKSLKRELSKIADYNLLPVRINKIEKLKRTIPMVDISVKNENFMANGIIVHNSAHRFEMNRDLAAKAHFKKVAEYMKEQFLDMKELKGIIIGGPGPTKHDFISQGQITEEVKKKIIAIKDLSYTEEFGLQELVDKSQDVLANEEIAIEKDIMNKFFTMLAKNPNMVSYGIGEVKKSLELGAVDMLLLSEELDDKTIGEMEELAKQFRSEVRIISTETREGAQLRDLGKVAAILRYEVH